MKEYLFRRLLSLIPTVFGVTILVFLMMRLIPGDPVSLLMGENATKELEADLRQQYGLDRPLYIQYTLWLGRLVTGDWGNSIIANRPILSDLARRVPITLELIVLAMGFALLIAIPAGIIAALRPYSWHDYSAMTTATIGVSVPDFFMGILLILCFSLFLGILPAVGYVPLTDSVWGNFKHMILPAVTLGLARAALLTRLIRASMMEVIRLDYVTTARAKGVRERTTNDHCCCASCCACCPAPCPGCPRTNDRYCCAWCCGCPTNDRCCCASCCGCPSNGCHFGPCSGWSATNGCCLEPCLGCAS